MCSSDLSFENLEIDQLSQATNFTEPLLVAQLSTGPNIELYDEQSEKEKIVAALKHTKNNKTQAAKLLKVDRKTLYNKIKLYGLDT